MTSTGNQHCANCIGTLSFPVLQPAQLYMHCVVSLDMSETETDYM